MELFLQLPDCDSLAAKMQMFLQSDGELLRNPPQDIKPVLPPRLCLSHSANQKNVSGSAGGVITGQMCFQRGGGGEVCSFICGGTEATECRRTGSKEDQRE